jgi:hypothetical protein
LFLCFHTCSLFVPRNHFTLWILFFFLIPHSFFILPSEINIVMPLFKASITKSQPFVDSFLLCPSPSHLLFLCLFILFLSSKLQPPNLAPFVDFFFFPFSFSISVFIYSFLLFNLQAPNQKAIVDSFLLFKVSTTKPCTLCGFFFSFFLFYLCVHLIFSSLQSSSTKPESHCRFFYSLSSSVYLLFSSLRGFKHKALHPLWILLSSLFSSVHLFFLSF